MEKLKLYVVTKSNTDNTLNVGNLIWLSENGNLNNAMIGGWLSCEEWNIENRNDFEYEISDSYYLDIVNGKECVRKCK